MAKQTLLLLAVVAVAGLVLADDAEMPVPADVRYDARDGSSPLSTEDPDLLFWTPEEVKSYAMLHGDPEFFDQLKCVGSGTDWSCGGPEGPGCCALVDGSAACWWVPDSCP